MKYIAHLVDSDGVIVAKLAGSYEGRYSLDIIKDDVEMAMAEAALDPRGIEGVYGGEWTPYGKLDRERGRDITIDKVIITRKTKPDVLAVYPL